MLAEVALRSVVAAALVAAPAEVVPAAPAPTTPAPAQKPKSPAPSATVTPAPASASAWDSRGYAGAEATTGAAPAESAPTPVHHEVAPPPVPEVAPPIVPPPVMAAGPGPEPEGPVDEAEPAYDPRVDSPEAKKARSWLNGGIVFTVVGGVLGIGGIAMTTAKVNVPGANTMACDPRDDPAGNGCQPAGRTRAAASLGITGLLLLAGGVTMIVVGKRQQARLRASLQADRRGWMLGASLRF